MTSTSHKTISEQVEEILEAAKQMGLLLGSPVDELEKTIKQLANLK